MSNIGSCYIHIPFCKKICSYCDFCKIFYNEKQISSYLDSLAKEIDDNYQGEVLDTLYIGGGTPSSLSLDDTKKLFSILTKLNLKKDSEVTIEANFDSITKEKIDSYVKFGINRISFGLESTQQWLLKKMNRDLDLDYVKEIVSYCKKVGISNINIDLMYGFQKETLEELEEDINFILALDVSHISTYSLILEEHTKLFIDKEKSASEDLDYAMYQFICSKLKDYDHYEISNFAKDKKYSRHNLCYWKNNKYYGFGLGASGYIDNIRYSNTRSISHYLKAKRRVFEEVIDNKALIEYEMILNLRTKFGIIKEEFKKKYGKSFFNFYNIEKLLSKGYLVEDKKSIYIPEKFWYLSNEIMVELLESECNG